MGTSTQRAPLASSASSRTVTGKLPAEVQKGAGLTGHEDVAIESFGRLHQLRLDAGDDLGAARAAFWAAMRSFSLGETARGGGWVARAQRLVEGRDCVEWGYLRLPHVFRLTASGDYAGARGASTATRSTARENGRRRPVNGATRSRSS